MATYVNNFRTGYKLECEVTTKSQSVANNSSVVNVKVYLTSTGSSYTINSSVQKKGTILIGGTDYGFSCYVSLKGNQRKLLHETDFTIPHNSDGSKSLSVSATVNLAVTLSGKYWGNVTASGTYTIAKIARGSSFTLSTTSVTAGSSTMNINISRANSAFTHKVYGQFGTRSWTINSNAGTSATWSPSISDCQYVTTSTSVTGKIWIETYNGSTLIATSASKSFTFNVPSSVVPTISSLSVTETGGNAGGLYIANKSKANIKITASGARSSTIISYSTTITGMSKSTSSSFTTGIFSTTGSKTITTTVKDSRGRTASKSVTINVTNYNVPTYTLKAVRSDENGNEDANNGTYYKVTYGVTAYNDLNNTNVLTWAVYTKKYNQTNWQKKSSGTGLKAATTAVFGDGTADVDHEHKVKIEVKDNFGTYTKEVTIPTAYVTIDFLAGGKGIAFGKVAELEDTFDVAMEGQFSRQLHTTRGTYCHKAGLGNGGQSGYLKVATINITGTHSNSPMVITFSRRRDPTPKELIIAFESLDSKDPELANFYIRGTNGNLAYLHKSATSQWDLYIQKSESYDHITITDFKASLYLMGKIEITWKNELYSDLPSGYVSPTYYNAFLRPTRGRWFNNGTPIVQDNGTMEIGNSIDFHYTNDSTENYDSRMRIGSTGNMHFTGGVYPEETLTVRLGSENYRWTQLYLRDNPNVSSDRALKEDITYIRNKAKTTGVSYTAMYDFVKDDLELATYTFKDDESKEIKMNFIAQDLLVHEDGTDNIIGQMIVSPIKPPTEEEIEGIKAGLEEYEEYNQPTLNYDVGMYISVLAGALKEAINEIEQLKNTIKELQDDINIGEE